MILRLTLLLIFFSFNTMAIEGVYTVIIEKQKEKIQSRWTLADWLSTKKRIALMDQWLALNTERTYFETVLDYRNYEYESQSNSQTITRFNDFAKAKFYFLFFGLEGEYEFSNEVIQTQRANLSLRLLGSSQQSTHFNLLFGRKWITSREYGFSGSSGEGEFTNNFYGVDGDIYLLSFIGLSGSYQKLLDSTLEGTTLNGETYTYGAFLELWFMRFYYELKNENYIFESSSTKNYVKRQGHTLGVSLYF